MQGFERTGELLAKLSAIGAPILTQFEDGCWSARVKFPAPEGVTADVRSDFKHGTPEEALQVCIDVAADIERRSRCEGLERTAWQARKAEKGKVKAMLRF